MSTTATIYRSTEWNEIGYRHDLLPCPFCQKAAMEEQTGKHERRFRITCGNHHCPMKPTSPGYDNIEDAEVDWERRTA